MHKGSGGDNNLDLPTGGSFGIIAAAHELKSPVALIRQLALSLGEMGEFNETQAEYLRRIVLASERSLRLTGNLTQAEGLNSMLFDTEPVNVQQLCEEVAHELSPLYSAYGRSIHVNKRRQAPIVVANRDLLRRILLGFGDNSLHYADGRGAVFNLQVNKKAVRVGLRDGGPRLIGLDKQKHHEQQRNYRPESSGLGLKISEQFANAMNGKLGVIRHRDGMTYYIDMIQSEQICLF